MRFTTWLSTFLTAHLIYYFPFLLYYPTYSPQIINDISFFNDRLVLQQAQSSTDGQAPPSTAAAAHHEMFTLLKSMTGFRISLNTTIQGGHLNSLKYTKRKFLRLRTCVLLPSNWHQLLVDYQFRIHCLRAFFQFCTTKLHRSQSFSLGLSLHPFPFAHLLLCIELTMPRWPGIRKRNYCLPFELPPFTYLGASRCGWLQTISWMPSLKQH